MKYDKLYKIDKKIIVPITKFFVSIGEKLKLSDKPLEKALSKKSSMIILSLVLAVIVFVIIDRQNTTLLEKNAEVLYDIPLSATYNDEHVRFKKAFPIMCQILRGAWKVDVVGHYKAHPEMTLTFASPRF